MSVTNLLAEDNVRNLVMPLSVAQYHQLCAIDPVLEKTELIEGIIFRKMTKSPLHEYIAQALYRFFITALSEEFLVRKEGPLTLKTSEPEPDIAVVKGKPRDFIKEHPDHAELVIEVAVSSLDYDRTKAGPYAAANIPEYWIILPESKTIERYTDPTVEGYQIVQALTVEDIIETLCGPLPLSELFG